MKSAIFALLVATASANWREYTVQVNQTAVRDFVTDAEKFESQWYKATKDELFYMGKSIADAYKTYQGKMILDFGKIVVPVIRDAADMWGYMQVNPGCDYQCATDKCFKTDRITMTCLHACKCVFKFETNNADFKKAAQKAEQSGKTFETYMEEREKEFLNSVTPAIRKYLEKEREVHDEFSAFLKKHAVNEFGCDSTCVNRCTNQNYITFLEMPSCVENCNCRQKWLRFKSGVVNYPALLEYNNDDLEAWRYYKSTQ